MEINLNNYQAFFLDYFENALEPQQVAELMVFLEANPELNSEFESFDPVFVEPETIKIKNKHELKKRNYISTKNITALNYEKWMVAGLENDLHQDETNELEDFLTVNPEARLEYGFFMKSRLTPVPISFKDKISLKKKGVFLLYRTEFSLALALAASLLIFFGLYFGLSTRNQNDEYSMENIPNELEPIEWFGSPDELSGISPRSEFAGNLLNADQTEIKDESRSNRVLTTIGKLSSVQSQSVLLTSAESNQSDLLFIDSRYDFNYKSGILEIDPNTKQASFAMRFLGGAIKNIFGERNNSKRSLLEFTIEGYNLMSDREVEVEKRYDNTGNVVAYQVNGEIIKIGRKVNPSSVE